VPRARGTLVKRERHTSIVTAVYGMAAVFAWGTSDFLGGYATRRANAFLFAVVFNIGGLIMTGSLAVGSHAVFPAVRTVLWVLLGGISGGFGVAIFFRALFHGKDGIDRARVGGSGGGNSHGFLDLHGRHARPGSPVWFLPGCYWTLVDYTLR